MWPTRTMDKRGDEQTMGYSLTISLAPPSARSPASPKTHVPLPRLQERGLRFYSPEVGRWLSFDPIRELGSYTQIPAKYSAFRLSKSAYRLQMLRQNMVKLMRDPKAGSYVRLIAFRIQAKLAVKVGMRMLRDYEGYGESSQSFVRNNALSGIDPIGLAWCTVIGGVRVCIGGPGEQEPPYQYPSEPGEGPHLPDLPDLPDFPYDPRGDCVQIFPHVLFCWGTQCASASWPSIPTPRGSPFDPDEDSGPALPFNEFPIDPDEDSVPAPPRNDACRLFPTLPDEPATGLVCFRNN
jgi:hypothetical protein